MLKLIPIATVAPYYGLGAGQYSSRTYACSDIDPELVLCFSKLIVPDL